MTVWLPLARALLGTWPATQACALTWESNQQLFGSQTGIQSTEPHQPGKVTEGFIMIQGCACVPMLNNETMKLNHVPSDWNLYI